MFASLLRWSCVVLPLLVAADCKPPRPYRKRAKVEKPFTRAAAPAASAESPPSLVPAPLSGTPSLAGKSSSPSGSSKPRSARERRDACEFKKGAMPEQTLDAEEPIGQRIPIDHFVIVMQENRSFDHYFHDLPKFGQPDVDVTPKGYVNPD